MDRTLESTDPAHRPATSGRSPVTLRLLSSGRDSPLDLRFVLAPVQSPRWEEAFLAAGTADSPHPPRLDRSTQPAEYVVRWDEGPQDVDVALQRLDAYIAEADAAVGRRLTGR